jgi:hypothetical protein
MLDTGQSISVARSDYPARRGALLHSSAMVTLYNKIANQSPERLAALSDGVFAFALTLLVLDLH